MAVLASINFLERDTVYQEEKPFLLTFKPPGEFPLTNVKLENHDLDVSDIRGRENQFSMAESGFAIMKIESELKYNDFDNEDLVSSVYLREIADSLKKFLGAARVQVFEHLLRKRHEIFPISTGEPYKYNQPTSIAHIDTTPEWTTTMAERLNSSSGPNSYSRYQCVNIWKPLRGPLRDWPLALCDMSTVEIDDIQAGDLVHSDFVIENCQVHYNRNQKWYYITDQQPNEAWVFMQSDSKYPWIKSGVPHSAFPYPIKSDCEIPRESIEARCIVWYDE